MTTYHNCRYFFKKSNQSEDMKICINYRWNLKIKSIQTIKFSFILSIQNPRQLPYIIVNINLSIIFFFLSIIVYKIWTCIQFLIRLLSLWCCAFRSPRFKCILVSPNSFFSIPMSTAHRIFQYCYWFSMSNKLKGNKKNRIMILHMLRLMDETRFCLLAGNA